MKPMTLKVNSVGQIVGLTPIGRNHVDYPLKNRLNAVAAAGRDLTSAKIEQAQAEHLKGLACQAVSQARRNVEFLRGDVARRKAMPDYGPNDIPKAGTFTRMSDGFRTFDEIIRGRGITDWDYEAATRYRRQNIADQEVALERAETTYAGALKEDSAAGLRVTAALGDKDAKDLALEGVEDSLEAAEKAMESDGTLRVSLSGWSPTAREGFMRWLETEGVQEMIELN